MKKLFITVIGLFVLLYGILIFICLHVLLKDTDDYLDNDKASLEMVSYGGKEDTFEYAVMKCDYNKVQEYLDKKTDVNQLLKESQKTPLMLAATLPEYEDVMKMSKLLLKYDADARQEDSHGANVLFYTVYDEYETRSSEDNLKILEFYMEKGASPDITIRNFDAEYNGFEENGGTNLTLVEYCQKKGMDTEAEYLKERSSNH